MLQGSHAQSSLTRPCGLPSSRLTTGYGYNEFEVDTAAPTVVSGTPTGRRVSRYANVMVTFDDNTYGSKKFVNVYKRGSNTPLPVSYRDEYSKKIVISTKSAFRSDTWYTVKVTTGVNDGANNLEAPKTWNFKTK